MKKILVVLLLHFCAQQTSAQHTLRVIVKSETNQLPLIAATVSLPALGKSALADSSGLAIFKNLPAGNYSVQVTYSGLEEKTIDILVPQPNEEASTIFLDEGEEEEEVVVMATRMSRSISDIPTRIETISGEELTEKGNMKPGDIRMLLNESTGIQTQQTSATSYNSSIRIQGLDGRYTQLLRDGFPLYAGFSGGLSLMQIAPLDLRQVEVIKGSASTLYGGGAIAGLVNLVSKTPGTERELSFLLNGTSARGLDMSGFYSERFRDIGLTVYGSGNFGSAYDPAGIGLTAIPAFSRYTINPRLFIYGKKTNANVGFSYITETRTGGSMAYVKDNVPGYYEHNRTGRFTTQLDIQHQINETVQLNTRGSFTRFNRKINIPSYIFQGRQQSSYGEVNLIKRKTKSDWIIGINILTDGFRETAHQAAQLRNYDVVTTGLFIQHNWAPLPGFSLETGLRGDYVNEYGFSLLPRISAMLKPSPKWTIRLGGGLGYKTPSVFNEEAERIQFQQILPVNQQTVNNEKSVGGNLDFNYRTQIGEVGVAFNQLFFYTRINRPLVLTTGSGGDLSFNNSDGFIDTRGTEINLRFNYKDFKLFVGYTYADVNTHLNGSRDWFPLTARHRLNNVLMYEIEEKLKIGLEAYYFSPQRLSDGSNGRSYWISGLMIEKLWERFSVFINFENIFDTRQTRFDSIFTGSIDQPVFRDIYAPVDGFVVNGGVKIRL